MDPVFETWRDWLRSGRAGVMATVVERDPGDLAEGEDLLPALGTKLVARPGADTVGSLGDPELDRIVVRDALGVLRAARGTLRHYGPHGEARRNELSVFFDVFAGRPHLVIFGAVDFTAALARLGKIMGYRVTVCDARPTFATVERFPDADEVVVDWPDRYLAKVGEELGPSDAVCVLTHDHKFDVPAIVAALGTEVGYLGAMGSRRTHAARVERLRAEGVGEAGLARLMAPIGLDIGARTPEETAVAVFAEIISLRYGVDAHSLRDGSGPIHTQPFEPLSADCP